ncbi:hypothetical protein [Fibrobacter sp. UWS1]|uniref:hypothetical protein n=1 Tax=Fibrobacter sp. UWS1 TaxID=1896220 RepID=UPI0013044FE1|nr:hypothetical protein [Fibrobacter sp. UWS1]
MQKNAFVHLVEDPKSKKTTFFIITNLPPQPFSSKYQTIFIASAPNKSVPVGAG